MKAIQHVSGYIDNILTDCFKDLICYTMHSIHFVNGYTSTGVVWWEKVTLMLTVTSGNLFSVASINLFSYLWLAVTSVTSVNLISVTSGFFYISVNLFSFTSFNTKLVVS